MSCQEEPNEDEIALQHLKVKGVYPRGPFSEQFPGLQPTVAQRRQYMRAFFQWHFYCVDPVEHERKLRELAELKLANTLIGHGIIRVSAPNFESGVDEEVWDAWFEGCPEESFPVWPWPFLDPQDDDPDSSKFAELLAKYEREGTLYPSPTEPKNAEDEETLSRKSIDPAEKSGQTTNTVQSAKPLTPSPLSSTTPARPPATKETIPFTNRSRYDDDSASAKKLCIGRGVRTSLQAATAARTPDVKPVVDAPVLEHRQARIAGGEKGSFASTMTEKTNDATSSIWSSFLAPGTTIARAVVAATPANILNPTAIQPSLAVPAVATVPLATQPETEQTGSMDLSEMADAMPPTSVKATLFEGKLFPCPCTPPDLGLRTLLWENNLPGLQPPYQEPFKLSLPVDFGFWSLVWGPNGKDWSKIQREFVDDRVCLAWGYEEHYVGTTRKVNGTLEDQHLPNVMQWLSVGLMTKVSRDKDGFSKTITLPTQNLAIKLWATLSKWMEECLSGHLTTLLNYLHRIQKSDITTGRVAKASSTLPSSFVARRAWFTSERDAAKQNINAILSSDRSVFENVKSLLETWVDSCKEGFAMSRHERVELAENIWLSRVVNPTFRGRIMDWAADLKEKALL
ncbi:hypothetical protein HG530_008624 [Fusarium avenaceum]|nr:hypothetical protein HG530_008624 [Fusarium avenaceum]